MLYCAHDIDILVLVTHNLFVFLKSLILEHILAKWISCGINILSYGAKLTYPEKGNLQFQN